MSGTLLHTPANILRWLLISLAQGTDPDADEDWPIYVSREPNAPDSVITIYNTTAVKQGRLMISGEVAERPGVQIRVRDPDEKSGFVKANAIAIALDGVTYGGVTLDGTAYKVYAVSRTSGPLSIGKEDSPTKRNIFTLNVTAALRQAD